MEIGSGGASTFVPALPADFHWGATKLTEFDTCPLRFANRYLRPKEEREWEPGRALAFGSAVHAGLEAIFKLRSGSALPSRRDVLGYYREHFLSDYIDGQARNLSAVRRWADEMLMPPCGDCARGAGQHCRTCGGIGRLIPAWMMCGYDSDEAARWYYVKGANIVGGYLADKAPVIRSNDISGELNFSYDLHGVKFRGKIDRIDRYVRSVSLLDYKTGKVDCSESAAGDNLQLWVYAAAVAVGAISRVDPSDKIMVGLENVENGTVGVREMTQPLFDKLWRKTWDLIGRAAAGDFTPTPKKYACSYCEVRDCRVRLVPLKPRVRFGVQQEAVA